MYDSSLLADPELSGLGPVDALLELEESIEKSLCSGRAARHIDVNWHHPVTTSDNSIAIMVIASSVGAAAHADHPFWLRHLIIDLSQCRCHLVCQGSCHNHHI
jgi:hypothetical protein